MQRKKLTNKIKQVSAIHLSGTETTAKVSTAKENIEKISIYCRLNNQEQG